MFLLAALFLAFFLPFFLLRRGARRHIAWAASCAVFPAFVLIGALIEPDALWVVALVVGGATGCVVASIGMFAAVRLLRAEARDAANQTDTSIKSPKS